MSEEIKPLPVVETPAAPVTESTPAPVETATVDAPKVEESKPVEAASEPVAPADTPAATTEEAKVTEPKESGHLLYHAPGNFFTEILPLPPKKVFFWFGEGAVEPAQLKAYLAKGKDQAHSTAAWASQTGKGLLFFNKHGEDQAAPSGALNLADAEEVKEVGTSEFAFKLHGHKHKFDAQNATERESWVAAIKKIAEEAKAKKDEIVASDGYKETLGKLKPGPIAAVTAPKVSEDAPKKSVEESAAAGEDSAKKASKSRSRSRGPLGFFKSKKEETKEEPKEEVAASEPAATEAAPVEPAPVTDVTAAPVITDAVPAVEDKKDDVVADEAKDEPKKETRRMSRLESFFKGKPREVKKDDAAVTAEEGVSEPAKVDEAPVIAEPTSEPAPVAAIATEEPAKEEAKEEEKKEEASSPTTKEHRKSSLLGGLKGFAQKVRSPSSEHPPATESKIDETPETAAAAEPSSEAPVTSESATEDAVVNGEAAKGEKRRSSFFNFGTIKKDKKADAPVEESAKTDVAPEVPAKDVEEPAKPVEETEGVAPEVPKKSSEEKTSEPSSPKEHKPSPFASIGRRVSKAIRGDKPKKESKVTPAVEGTKEESKLEEPTSETAPTLPEPIKQEETTQPAIGDVVPEAVTVGTAPTATQTVSATA